MEPVYWRAAKITAILVAILVAPLATMACAPGDEVASDATTSERSVARVAESDLIRGVEEPSPIVRRDGPSLDFDFPEMRIGVAEYEEGPTGTTVFYFPEGVKAAVNTRGGSPGTLNTD